MAWQHIGDHLGRTLAGVSLESLGEADDRDPGTQERRRLLQHRAHSARGDRHHEDVGAARGLLQDGGRPQLGVQIKTGEVAGIAMAGLDLVGHCLVPRPDRGGRVGRGQRTDGRAPRPGAHHDNLNRATHRGDVVVRARRGAGGRASPRSSAAASASGQLVRVRTKISRTSVMCRSRSFTSQSRTEIGG